jgi:hypothetical protein
VKSGVAVLTASFEEIYEVYMASLDPQLTDDERTACMHGFVSGMAAGVGVLQNRIAASAMDIRELPPKEKAKGFQIIAQVCAESVTDLNKLQMDIRGKPYGTA